MQSEHKEYKEEKSMPQPATVNQVMLELKLLLSDKIEDYAASLFINEFFALIGVQIFNSSDFLEQYKSKLFNSFIPALLAHDVSLATLDIEKYLDFLNLPEKQTFLPLRNKMLFDFIVNFAICSGTTLDVVINKLQMIYRRYPMLPSDDFIEFDENDQRKMLEQSVGRSFYKILHQSICAPDDFQPISKRRILLALRKNPDLLKLAKLPEIRYQFLDERIARFNGNGGITYYDVEQKRFNPDHAEIVGKTLFSDAIKKKDPVFCHGLLDIMQSSGFTAQTIKDILTLPVKHINSVPAKDRIILPSLGNLLLDVCYAGDDPWLYERMAQYEDKPLTDEYKKMIVLQAIRYNRLNILLHLKKIGFDIVKLLKGASLQLPNNLNPQILTLLFKEGLSPNTKAEGSYLLEFLLDKEHCLLRIPLRSVPARDGSFDANITRFLQSFDGRKVNIAIVLLEANVDLKRIQAHHAPVDVIQLWMQALAKKQAQLAKQEPRILYVNEVGNLAYLQGLITEKVHGKEAAEHYYDIARQNQHFRKDVLFIQNKLQQLKDLSPTTETNNAAQLFDEINACFTYVMQFDGAKEKTFLSPSDALSLVSVGITLPPNDGSVDVRAKACSELWKHANSVAFTSLTLEDQVKWLWISVSIDAQDKTAYLANLQKACQLYRASQKSVQQSEATDLIHHLMVVSPFLPFQLFEESKEDLPKNEGALSQNFLALKMQTLCRKHLQLSLSAAERQVFEEAGAILDQTNEEDCFIAKLQRTCQPCWLEEKPQMIEQLCQLIAVAPVKLTKARPQTTDPVQAAIIHCQRCLQRPLSLELSAELEKTLAILQDYEKECRLLQLEHACEQYQKAYILPREKNQEIFKCIFKILEIKPGSDAFKEAIAYCQKKLSDVALISNKEEKIYRQVLQVLLEEKYIKEFRKFYGDYNNGKVRIYENTRTQEIQPLLEAVSEFKSFLSAVQQSMIEETTTILREHHYVKQVHDAYCLYQASFSLDNKNKAFEALKNAYIYKEYLRLPLLPQQEMILTKARDLIVEIDKKGIEAVVRKETPQKSVLVMQSFLNKKGFKAVSKDTVVHAIQRNRLSSG